MSLEKYKLLIPLAFAILIGLAVAFFGISSRISKTGWEKFPATPLDWLSIAGSAGIVVGLILFLIYYFRRRKSYA
ncbi:MAG: hypothetical protein JJU46_02785 [Balneolaceae bacterium]|nr:hypothetical protein [Balneolaceae bacterium]MCH8548394.1 hypothetical protein [Balneolaceae bacterium]